MQQPINKDMSAGLCPDGPQVLAKLNRIKNGSNAEFNLKKVELYTVNPLQLMNAIPNTWFTNATSTGGLVHGIIASSQSNPSESHVIEVAVAMTSGTSIPDNWREDSKLAQAPFGGYTPMNGGGVSPGETVWLAFTLNQANIENTWMKDADTDVYVKIYAEIGSTNPIQTTTYGKLTITTLGNLSFSWL